MSACSSCCIWFWYVICNWRIYPVVSQAVRGVCPSQRDHRCCTCWVGGFDDFCASWSGSCCGLLLHPAMAMLGQPQLDLLYWQLLKLVRARAATQPTQDPTTACMRACSSQLQVIRSVTWSQIAVSPRAGSLRAVLKLVLLVSGELCNMLKLALTSAREWIELIFAKLDTQGARPVQKDNWCGAPKTKSTIFA